MTMQSTLSRTSSAASISSDDAALTRRTRKRFTNVQLMLLEQLFHQSSHPTREEREAVAQAAGMEMKSVTIWFQNKRQTERKVALHHGSSQTTDQHHTSTPNVSSSSSLLSSPYASSTASASTPHSIRARTRTLSTTHTHTSRRKVTPPRARPSLDSVAARSESRLPPPRTPSRPHDPHASLWDNMPSSPLAPPASPPARDLVEFMGGSRTLEWACAAARLAGKEGRRRPRASEREQDKSGGDKTEVGLAGAEYDTEDDDVEAVTPEGSLGASGTARWHHGQGVHARSRPCLAFTTVPDLVPEGHGQWTPYGDSAKAMPGDEDMMRAALALCGLHQQGG